MILCFSVPSRTRTKILRKLPRAANILESVRKIYIEDEGLEMPTKRDLQNVWAPVRKHLGFDPSKVEHQDLQHILTGMLSVVHGVGALRTHQENRREDP